MNHQEDVENIQSLVYKSLKPLMRKGEKRFIRVQISNSLFLQLKNNNITGRFKDATHLVELLNLPTVYQVETGRSSACFKQE